MFLVIFVITFSILQASKNELCESTEAKEQISEQNLSRFLLNKKTEFAGIEIEVDGPNVHFTLLNENNIGNIFLFKKYYWFYFQMLPVMQGQMGMKIPQVFGEPEQPESCPEEQDLCLRWILRVINIGNFITI